MNEKEKGAKDTKGGEAAGRRQEGSGGRRLWEGEGAGAGGERSAGGGGEGEGSTPKPGGGFIKQGGWEGERSQPGRRRL